MTGLEGTALNASLTVNDLPASLAWYENVLGFAVDQKHEREGKLVAASIRAGAVRLLLAQDDGAKGRERERRGILAADHDGAEHRRDGDRDQRARRHARLRAGGCAVGRAHLPTARSGRLPVHGLLVGIALHRFRIVALHVLAS